MDSSQPHQGDGDNAPNGLENQTTPNQPTQTSDNKKKPDTKDRCPQCKGPKHWKLTSIHLICLLVFVPTGHSTRVSPHQPLNVTWTIYSMMTGTIANSTSKLTPPTTWFPDLLADLCDLVTTDWDPSDQQPSPWIWMQDSRTSKRHP